MSSFERKIRKAEQEKIDKAKADAARRNVAEALKNLDTVVTDEYKTAQDKKLLADRQGAQRSRKVMAALKASDAKRERKYRRYNKKEPKFTQEERLVRRVAMQTRKLMGRTNAQIAEEFNLSKDRVSAELRKAQREGLASIALDLLSTDLLPLAVLVYADKLRAGSLDAARDVLQALNILGKGGGINIAVDNRKVEIESFEAYRLKLAEELRQQESADGTTQDVTTGTPAPDPGNPPREPVGSVPWGEPQGTA